MLQMCLSGKTPSIEGTWGIFKLILWSLTIFSHLTQKLRHRLLYLFNEIWWKNFSNFSFFSLLVSTLSLRILIHLLIVSSLPKYISSNFFLLLSKLIGVSFRTWICLLNFCSNSSLSVLVQSSETQHRYTECPVPPPGLAWPRLPGPSSNSNTRSRYSSVDRR